jgi:hypothetical protein
MTECNICDKPAEELCQDGVCRRCHVSLSFEDCTDGTFSAAASRRLGRSEEQIKEMFPSARNVDFSAYT